MAKYLLDKFPYEGEPLTCKIIIVVLELGCGSGLPSVALSIIGHNCIMTDIEKVIVLAEQAKELNKEHLKGELTVDILDWTN